MIRKITIALLFLFIYTTAFSQNYYGFKIGANVSNLLGSKIENNSSKSSIHVGGVMEFPINDKLSIQPELLFSIQGFSDNTLDIEEDYNLNYINVPVIAKYFVSDAITIDGGIQVGYFLSTKKLFTDYGFENITPDNKFDFGLNVGTSYEFDDGMNINLRYNYGFLSVLQGAHNSVLQLSVGYKFY